jgi:hypothetical protein
MTVEYQHCATCNATMHPMIWRSHIRSAQHRDSRRRENVTPLLFARSLLVLAAGLTVLAYVAFAGGREPGPLFVAAVVALVGACIVGRR